MEEIIQLITNNGAAVACLIYFMWYNNNTAKELKHEIEKLNECMIKILTKIGDEK